MPTTLFILSDMQFNTACGTNERTNFEEIERKYQEAGYQRAKIVFWNLRGNHTTLEFPVPSKDVQNCVLISGFSPDVIELLLDNIIPTPYTIMRKAIDAKRYERITL